MASKVYLAGPISLGGTLDPAGREANIARFKQAVAWLEERGYEVADPTTNHGDPSWTWRQWMVPALHQLIDADAIALLPGWHHSRGAIIEFNLALQLGHAVIDLPPEPVS